MTHEEYVSRLESLSDDDAAAVLAHAENCAQCRRERRAADAELSRLEPKHGSIVEEIARVAAVVAFLVIAIYGLRPPSAGAPAPAKSSARYRVVGDASGVVAYTPGGIVVGTARRPSSKEVVR